MMAEADIETRTADKSVRAPEFSGLAGVARGDITPPPGIYARTWGSSTHDIAKGVHRPLLATCAIFADSIRRNELVLLALDLGWWRSKSEEWSFRSAILAATGLEPRQLILHLSHTHGAPSTALALANRSGGHLIAEFGDRIRHVCTALIAKARADLKPCVLSWTTGSCRLAVNRDFVSPIDGSILCGLNPDAPADDTLLVGRVADLDGTIRFTLVNYACHPTSLGGGNQWISPDYPGAMREVIERETGRAPCLFLHGPSGDMTPRRSFGSDLQMAEQNGREIAYASLAALSAMLPPGSGLTYEGIEQSGTALAVWRERPVVVNPELRALPVTLELEVADIPTRAELQTALGQATDRFMIERLERRLMQRESLGDGETAEFPLLVWQLGDAFIVALPAEAHTPFQIALRLRFPGTPIIVLNIANGYLSYIPPQADYDLNTYQVKVALFTRGAAEKIGDAAANAIAAMLAATNGP